MENGFWEQYLNFKHGKMQQYGQIGNHIFFNDPTGDTLGEFLGGVGKGLDVGSQISAQDSYKDWLTGIKGNGYKKGSYSIQDMISGLLGGGNGLLGGSNQEQKDTDTSTQPQNDNYNSFMAQQRNLVDNAMMNGMSLTGKPKGARWQSQGAIQGDYNPGNFGWRRG